MLRSIRKAHAALSPWQLEAGRDVSEDTHHAGKGYLGGGDGKGTGVQTCLGVSIQNVKNTVILSGGKPKVCLNIFTTTLITFTEK